MLVEIVNRILIVAFMLSVLTTLRHLYYFVQAFLTSTEEQPIKYRISKASLFFLGMSLAYILSVFFTGIKL
jgi:Sec-independent protein secretion pathway component TatC